MLILRGGAVVRRLSKDCYFLLAFPKLDSKTARRAFLAPALRVRREFRGEPSGEVNTAVRLTENQIVRISDRAFFSRFHILAQNGVDHGLIASALLAEKRQNIRINPQGYLFLRSRPDYRMGKEIRPLLWNVGKIDIFIPERVNPLPVRSGSPFRILSALHDLPFSAR